MGKPVQTIPWLVFLFSITIVLISLVSVVFPAILSSSEIPDALGIPKAGPSQYEPGILLIPLIVANITVFGIFYLYKKNRLPRNLETMLKKLFNFETSKKTSFVILAIILGIYVAASAGELGTEEKWADYVSVKQRVESWEFAQALSSFEPHVNYFFIKSSMDLFGNYKVIPFLASISLLVVTYFVTKTITQKRFAGIVSTIVLLQSNLFLTYDTSVAYSNFWILFYLLSLFLVYRFWPLSPIAYILSIPAKPITLAFFPMSIYFVLRSDISKNRKIMIVIPIILIIAVLGVAYSSLLVGEAQVESFDGKDFWMGFTSFSFQLRFDVLVILFMIPLMVGLFVASKSGIKHADSIMVLISGMLLIAPILTAVTNQTNQPYRFMPLIVFFAIGVGILLSKPKIRDVQRSK